MFIEAFVLNWHLIAGVIVRFQKKPEFIIRQAILWMLLLVLKQFCLSIGNGQIVNRGIRRFCFPSFLRTRPWRGPVPQFYHTSGREATQGGWMDGLRDKRTPRQAWQRLTGHREPTLTKSVLRFDFTRSRDGNQGVKQRGKRDCIVYPAQPYERGHSGARIPRSDGRTCGPVWPGSGRKSPRAEVRRNRVRRGQPERKRSASGE